MYLVDGLLCIWTSLHLFHTEKAQEVLWKVVSIGKSVNLVGACQTLERLVCRSSPTSGHLCFWKLFSRLKFKTMMANLRQWPSLFMFCFDLRASNFRYQGFKKCQVYRHVATKSWRRQSEWVHSTQHLTKVLILDDSPESSQQAVDEFAKSSRHCINYRSLMPTLKKVQRLDMFRHYSFKIFECAVFLTCGFPSLRYFLEIRLDMFAILTVSFFAGLRFLISAAYDWCQAKLGGEPEWKWINLHLGWRWHLPLGPHSVSSGLLAPAPAVQVCHSAESVWLGESLVPHEDQSMIQKLHDFANRCLGYLFDVFLWGYDRKAVLFLDDQCPQSLWISQSQLHMQPMHPGQCSLFTGARFFFFPYFSCGWKVMTSSNSFPSKIHYASGKIGFRFAAVLPFCLNAASTWQSWMVRSVE